MLLVGDTKQLSAVDAGNPFKSLQAGGIALARLDHSLRQKTEELKVAVQLIAEGKVARGIDVLEQAGCLHMEPELENKINQMVSDYMALSPGARAETLLLAGTNQERAILTKQLRQALHFEGSLGTDELDVLSLHRKDLTSVQARYVSAYVLGDILIPTQDYKKQGLVKYQQYVVRGLETDSNQLVVETGAGQLMRVDPAKCDRKTVYRVQPMTVAVGDRLRWTKNNRVTKTRNGQLFTVAEVAADGKVLAIDKRGQGRWFDLSGRQHVDYAWVSTTYGSQGKTADRVLALMGAKTTNREAFYVAVSRAKHGLMLYVADKTELIRQTQTSRAKENASDYIPLFIKVGENDAKTEKENYTAAESASTSDGGDIEYAVGTGLGEHCAQEFSGNTYGPRRTRSANWADGGGVEAFDGGLESIAAVLGEQVESLSHAVAKHVEQSEFIDCEGFFAEAVAAVNCGFEQLECAAKNRDQLAAKVDRLNAAVGGSASKGSAEAVGEKIGNGQLSTDECDYGALWQYYQQGIEAPSAGERDYRVGRRAFKHGVGQKEIALMLAAGSEAVQQIYRSYGKPQAMRYVNQMAHLICEQRSSKVRTHISLRQRQVEIE